MNPDLYRAATNGDVKLLEQVAKNNMQLLLSKAPQQTTALHIAASLGHKDFIKEILQLCSQLLRMKNSDDGTALHIAVQAGSMEIVEILVDYRLIADVEEGGSSCAGLLRMQNEEGDTALHDAVRKKREDMAIKMLQADPKLPLIVNKAKESSFLLAVKEEMEAVVKEILFTDRSLNNGEQISTAVGNNSELTEEEKRELINMQDKAGKTALHYAACRNNAKIVGMLLRSNSKNVPYIIDENGLSPLHMAIAFGMQDSMSEILEHCPDAIEQLDKDGRNVLHIAVLYQRYGIIQWLLPLPRIGRLLNKRDKDGNTPIHLFRFSSRIGLLNSLFWDKRVDISVRNNDGLTALDLDALSWFLPKAYRHGPAWGSYQDISHEIPTKNPNPEPGSKESDGGESKKEYFVVVASLIATCTFAAAFTLPGGYRGSDEHNPGTAILSNKSDFEDFLLNDTYAMCLSITAIICYILGSTHKRNAKGMGSALFFNLGDILTFTACSCMLLAFASGVSLVLPPDKRDLAQAISTTCSLLPIFFLFFAITIPFIILMIWTVVLRRAGRASAAHAWNKS